MTFCKLTKAQTADAKNKQVLFCKQIFNVSIRKKHNAMKGSVFSTYQVEILTGTLSSPAVGTIIKYYSRTTSSFGYGSVGRRNVEVKASSGKTIGGLTELKVTYGSCESGDSGGPFFQDASSGAKYCGVLHGNRTDSSGNMYVFSHHIHISLALVFRSGQANYAQLGVHLDACFAMPFLIRLKFLPLLTFQT